MTGSLETSSCFVGREKKVALVESVDEQSIRWCYLATFLRGH